jgi:hypothetical protein
MRPASLFPDNLPHSEPKWDWSEPDSPIGAAKSPIGSTIAPGKIQRSTTRPGDLLVFMMKHENAPPESVPVMFSPISVSLQRPSNGFMKNHSD